MLIIKRQFIISTGIVILLAVIVMGIILRLDSINHTNTTFDNEVLNNIKSEISALQLFSTSNEKNIALKNHNEIEQTINMLSSLELKKIKKFSSQISVDSQVYSIVISIQNEITYYINLFENNELSITNFKKDSIQRYQIESNFDIKNITKYWAATSE
ncbi:hypothetical protein [Paenibacillus sp. MMO-58]|uniref:hypothetical protein n=1 Tax=Paenibacillus sp. MMO-58 TaxID=3081290 RepID=UPI00301961EF